MSLIRNLFHVVGSASIGLVAATGFLFIFLQNSDTGSCLGFLVGLKGLCFSVAFGIVFSLGSFLFFLKRRAEASRESGAEA